MSPCGFASGLARACAAVLRKLPHQPFHPAPLSLQALQQWAKERMTRYKQSTVQEGQPPCTTHSECMFALSQEQRYMEMPRDWEEKINREMVNVGILR